MRLRDARRHAIEGNKILLYDSVVTFLSHLCHIRGTSQDADMQEFLTHSRTKNAQGAINFLEIFEKKGDRTRK